MKTFTVILTDQQINNAFAFLDRVTVTGHKENAAFQDLTDALKAGKPINEPDQKSLAEKEVDLSRKITQKNSDA